MVARPSKHHFFNKATTAVFLPNGRIFLKNNRIRDIDYDDELDLIILISENIPAIITLSKI